MAVRGARRRRGYERGLQPSASRRLGNGLLRKACAIRAPARCIDHGNSDRPARYLTRTGKGAMRNPCRGALKAEALNETTGLPLASNHLG